MHDEIMTPSARTIRITSDAKGGVVVPLDGTFENPPTAMGALLAAHGDELLAWLGKRFTPMAAEPFKMGGKK